MGGLWHGFTYIKSHLVGGLEHEFYVSIQLGMSSSQVTRSYFSEGLVNHQPAIHAIDPYRCLLCQRGLLGSHFPRVGDACGGAWAT